MRRWVSGKIFLMGVVWGWGCFTVGFGGGVQGLDVVVAVVLLGLGG